jgi:hypothetical protein
MGLRAVKPEVVTIGKPKILISGASGVGKTLFSLDFPRPYLIDSEGGATRPQYRDKLKQSNGAYFGKEQGAADFKTVVNEFKELATTKHDYKTVILDSFSYAYMMEAAAAEESGGSEYGRDVKEANKPARQLLRWIDSMDMSVILTAHLKDKYAKGANAKERVYAGTTFDGFQKLEYLLDLWIEVEKIGKNRSFVVKKSRIDAFPEGERFPLEYKKFAELYGEAIIDRPTVAVTLATPEQVAKIKGLLDVVKMDNETIVGWFKKVEVSSWEEMDSSTIQKAIDFMEKRVKAVK